MACPNTSVLTIALSIASLSGATHADNTLNPRTYTSPDGTWSAMVEPQTKEGDAGARYVIKHRDEQVWGKDLSFALWDATITDSGVVAGFAYEHGLDGRAFHKPDSGHSFLYAIIIDQAGNVRLQDGHARHWPPYLSNPPSPFEPVASGVMADPITDTFVIRISGSMEDDGYTWWRYRLSTGDKLDEIAPDQPRESNEYGFHREIRVLPVNDAPLVLAHWYTSNLIQGQSTEGAVVQLVDLSGKELWHLDLPGEYDALGERWNWYDDLVHSGIRQIELSGRQFVVRSYSLHEKIEYAISGDADAGWLVKELSRTPDNLPNGSEEADSDSDAPLVSLKLLGTIELGEPAHAPQAIENIHGFSIDDRSNIGFVHRAPDAREEFVLVSPEGEVLKTWPLPKFQPPVGDETVWLEPGKWLIYATGLGEDQASASVLDIEIGSVATLPIGLGGIIEASRTTGGGFAVIGGTEWVDASSLVVFDRDGHQLWSADVFSPEDVACTSRGEIVALENISNKLVYFSPDGGSRRELELKDAIGHEPEYPTGLTSDVDGGLILFDFAGKPTIRRLSGEGKELQGFTPHYEDGRTFRLVGNVQRAPDGTLWTSDSHAFLRLSDEGVVNRVLGHKPGEGDLDKVQGMAIGPDGRIYVVNDRDSRIHIFDAKGAPLSILMPDPEDFGIGTPCESLSVAAEGEVYCARSDWSGPDHRSGYVHFDGDGRRIGFEPSVFDTITERWLFKPGTRARWILGHETIALTDADGKIIKTIAKRPNGEWLDRVDSGAVAPDGSLAVIASPGGWGMRGPATINVFSAEGKPVCTLPCEGQWIPSCIAFNGQTIATSRGQDLQFYHVDGRPVVRATLPLEEDKQEYWYLYFSPDGSELWARNADALEIRRFDVP